MPNTYKQLCAVAPAAATLTPIYTAPVGAQVIVSSLAVCNRSATQTTFRLSHAVNGAGDTLAQYFIYDAPLGPNQMLMLTVGMCLGPADVVRAYVGAATVNVLLWGEERTP